MTKRLAVVTGASGGIGEAIAGRLVDSGFEVWGVARAGPRLESAIARLEGGGRMVSAVPCDLSRLRDVEALGARLASRTVDVLILNAALMPGPRAVTPEGLEQTFATNHVAPFLLAARTRQALIRASQGRVVVVGADPSMLTREPVDLDDLEFERGYVPVRAYMRTKNMNAMFAYALARRFEGTSVTVNGAHPGIIRTDLVRNTRGPMSWLFSAMRPFLPSPEVGARTPAWLALEPSLHATTGRFFVKQKSVETAPHTRDVGRQEELWRRTEARLAAL